MLYGDKFFILIFKKLLLSLSRYSNVISITLLST